MAILAVGMDLLWGYAGILSLCQAVFFGLGGYAMGMYLMLEIGSEQSKYGEAIPDFMVWNQVKELPWFWKPFDHFARLNMGIQQMFLTGKPAYPVERTLLTTGILDAAMHSRFHNGEKRHTPELALSYQAR